MLGVGRGGHFTERNPSGAAAFMGSLGVWELCQRLWAAGDGPYLMGISWASVYSHHEGEGGSEGSGTRFGFGDIVMVPSAC